jgi:hypothetical protein
MITEKEIWVTSSYGAKARSPLVNFHYQDVVIQMEPEKAREVALMLLEVSEASEQDAFMFEYAQKVIGVDENSAGGLLIEFRKWRQEHGKRTGDATE